VIQGNEIWVRKTALLETEWALRGLYGFPPVRLAGGALRSLAGLRSVFRGDEFAVAKALDWFKEGLDFAHALSLASAGNAGGFATFDRKLAPQARRATSLETVSV
jgi:hypothetical protein